MPDTGFDRSATKWALIFAMALVACSLAQVVQAQGPPATDRQKLAAAGFQKDVAPFLKQYCVRCHGSKKQNGMIAVHELKGHPLSGPQVGIWKKIFDQVESDHMPPDHVRQPTMEQRQQALSWIKRELSNGLLSLRCARPGSAVRFRQNALEAPTFRLTFVTFFGLA